MHKRSITIDGAIAFRRAFDKKSGRKTNEETVARRGYELIRLVAINNSYGAKQKENKITLA